MMKVNQPLRAEKNNKQWIKAQIHVNLALGMDSRKKLIQTVYWHCFADTGKSEK